MPGAYDFRAVFRASGGPLPTLLAGIGSKTQAALGQR